jgi:hypothetical protein
MGAVSGFPTIFPSLKAYRNGKVPATGPVQSLRYNRQNLRFQKEKAERRQCNYLEMKGPHISDSFYWRCPQGEWMGGLWVAYGRAFFFR